MTIKTAIDKYRALSQIYHAAGGDKDPVNLAIYNAGYSALADAVGGQAVLNEITSTYARDGEAWSEEHGEEEILIPEVENGSE